MKLIHAFIHTILQSQFGALISIHPGASSTVKAALYSIKGTAVRLTG